MPNRDWLAGSSILREADSTVIWLPGGVWGGAGVSEAQGAFGAMLAGIERSRCLSTHHSKVPLT
jgi:hypothetical protein